MKKEKKDLIKSFKAVIEDLLDNYEKYTDEEKAQIKEVFQKVVDLNTVLDIYNKEKCNKLIILGDLFNYGIDLNRDDIINRLNIMKNNIIAVSGNCDNNIRDILFDMPYSIEIKINNKNALLTHGHLYSREYLLDSNQDIIISGHTHIPLIEKINNKLFLNPGSISKSRNGENTFMIIDNNLIKEDSNYSQIKGIINENEITANADEITAAFLDIFMKIYYKNIIIYQEIIEKLEHNITFTTIKGATLRIPLFISLLLSAKSTLTR